MKKQFWAGALIIGISLNGAGCKPNDSSSSGPGGGGNGPVLDSDPIPSDSVFPAQYQKMTSLTMTSPSQPIPQILQFYFSEDDMLNQVVWITPENGGGSVLYEQEKNKSGKVRVYSAEGAVAYGAALSPLGFDFMAPFLANQPTMIPLFDNGFNGLIPWHQVEAEFGNVPIWMRATNAWFNANHQFEISKHDDFRHLFANPLIRMMELSATGGSDDLYLISGDKYAKQASIQKVASPTAVLSAKTVGLFEGTTAKGALVVEYKKDTANFISYQFEPETQRLKEVVFKYGAADAAINGKFSIMSDAVGHVTKVAGTVTQGKSQFIRNVSLKYNEQKKMSERLTAEWRPSHPTVTSQRIESFTYDASGRPAEIAATDCSQPMGEGEASCKPVSMATHYTEKGQVTGLTVAADGVSLEVAAKYGKKVATTGTELFSVSTVDCTQAFGAEAEKYCAPK